MKRKGNLFNSIVTIENLEKADIIGRKHKRKSKDVVEFDKQIDFHLRILYDQLISGNYTTSNYKEFTIYEPKERHISKLPYIDRIVHHLLIGGTEQIFLNSFITQTYSCIKGRGIHKCLMDFNKVLKQGMYCLKIDIKKFYPSVDNEILKCQLRRKFKDEKLLNLFYNIIDSKTGLPLGNYTSQIFGNFYLSSFDHWLKQDKKIENYFRYCDDSIILHYDKNYLQTLRREIQEYLGINLKLELSNYRIFPVELGIDFLGYVSFPDHRLIRKSIKKAFKRMLAKYPNKYSIASYLGWLKHCNSIHLIKTLNIHNGKEISFHRNKSKEVVPNCI